MAADDFSLTAGWGHFGQGEAVMPGQGRVVERPYTAEERAALGSAAERPRQTPLLTSTSTTAPTGETCPAAVWQLQAGRVPGAEEVALLQGTRGPGSPPATEEVQHFTDTARRIVAVLVLMGVA